MQQGKQTTLLSLSLTLSLRAIEALAFLLPENYIFSKHNWQVATLNFFFFTYMASLDK